MAVRVPPFMRRIRSAARGRPRLPARLNPRRARIFAILGLLGPGLIAANAGNDAGGVATYSAVGAKYGYGLLWTIVLIAFSLAIVQKLAARMGVVTGKGLSELVREEYGIRWSVFATSAVLVANLGICISDFVGVGAALGLAGVPVQLSVPIAAFGIWLIIVRGSYRSAERIFIWFTIPFFAYPIAAILAHPKWSEVGKAIVTPQLHASAAYLLLLIATVGTTITPYMQLYLQSATVERGVREEDLRREESEAVSGAVFACIISAFIVIATGATLYTHGIHEIGTAADAARALTPFAGQFAETLFGIGLLGASLLACAILPIATSYVVSESLGYEKGLGRNRGEAPVFVGIITAMIVVSTIVAVIPGDTGDRAAGRRAGRQRDAPADQSVLHLAPVQVGQGDGRASKPGRDGRCNGRDRGRPVGVVGDPGACDAWRNLGRRGRRGGAIGRVDQQRGADRPPEVTQRGDLDMRRSRVGEQVRLHRLSHASRDGGAEPDAQPATEDHGLDVEQVDRRGDPRAECLDRPVEHVLGHLVALLERSRPDAAGEPGAVVVLHQLQKVCLLAFLDELAHVLLHGRTPRICLHTAPPAAGTAGAADLHDHVADLTGATTPTPLLPLQDHATSDTGAPRNPEQRRERTCPAPRWNSAAVATWTSLPSFTSGPSSSFRAFASGNVPSQSGRLRARVTSPPSTVPGEPTPMPPSWETSTLASCAASRIA